MFARIFFIGIALCLSSTTSANERLAVNFALMLNDVQIDQGSILVSSKISAWNKGLQKSYLKLRCKTLADGTIEKSLSTVNLFDGLQVTQQRSGDAIDLTVVLSKVKPRLSEIKKLAKNECVDLSPEVTKTTEKYSFPAKKGIEKSHPFGKSMAFKVNTQ